ncbi:ribonuclease p protein subunit p14, putative [Acanthamoeba castellanii str. Neff]|uniref:Ribonuclease p protein subunit p14, putative n=1 Tax=Acanthamoeba castellanii (strain ATCC 30010 / Neff) TaxID=1257118 RepID=L8GJT2_ACACF|nr:ribonuclease p protein subunit p14, putative [Acanthamoeba castellanii str. Neff]ELR13335.1 ribonuclease p protein subunit p14, putative [Acanthamoeba castellanii str. Neff]
MEIESSAIPEAVKANIHPDFCYLRIRLVVQQREERRTGLHEEPFRAALLQAVTSFFGHGLAGAGLCDRLVFVTYNHRTNTGIVRVPASDLTALWGALTLTSRANGDSCRYEVERATPFLPSLGATSREFFDDFAVELGLRQATTDEAST